MKTIQELKKIIDSRTWTVASTPAHLMTCYAWAVGFVRMKRVYSHYCSDMWLIIKDALGFQAFSEPENYENVKQLYDDPKRTREIRDAWLVERAAFLAKAEEQTQNLSLLSDAALGRDFSDFLETCTKTWESSAAIDNMGIYTEGQLLLEFTEAIPESERRNAHEYFAAISQPSDRSYVMREHISLLRIARLLKDGAEKAMEALSRHQREFYWIANSYKDIKELPVDHFLELAKEESAKSDAELEAAIRDLESLPKRIEVEREALLSRFAPPKELEEKLRITPIIGAWLDERKEVTVRGNHYLTVYLREIGKRNDYSLEEMYYFTPPEIDALLLGGTKVPKQELAARRHRLVYVISESDDSMLISGTKAAKLIEYFERATGSKTSATSVRGIVASRGPGGTMQGRVQVVLDPEGVDFKKGNVLVSTMTRAEYVPFMKQASAIVTDEGGITCHAAVVSRELRKPCIIGTKIATKVLKDGDLVEVNTNHGSVKILKNN